MSYLLIDGRPSNHGLAIMAVSDLCRAALGEVDIGGA